MSKKMPERDEGGLFLSYEASEKSRIEVKALVSFGNTREQISTYLNIDMKTLAKYYKRELETAAIHANAQVARGLFNKAVMQDDLSAQIFWLKTRARWREKDVIEELEWENDKIKRELEDLRAKLDEKHKSDY